jgi:hypothetical protein
MDTTIYRTTTFGHFNTMVTLFCLQAILLSGCLSFGSDEETTSPTKAQVTRCVREMYINPKIEIRPMGFKLEGSGIDDAIWFKFETDAELANIFDSKMVDAGTFQQRSNSAAGVTGPKWWHLPQKVISSEAIALPNARYMSVYIEKHGKRHIVSIFWHET